MAYTTTPALQTYETKRIPCVYDLNIAIGSANPTSSYGMKNIVPVKVGNEIWGESRYNLDFSNVTADVELVRGMFVWEKTVGTIYYYVVVADFTTSTVYSSTDTITWSAVNTLGTNATTPVRFTEFIDATNTKKLVMVDGVEGYVFTSNAAGTKIVDVDFPTPHVPFPVFLDGYLFLAKAGTGDIYNSDLNDPAVWTAGSFISAEQYPDDIQALLKIDNYVVAVGTQGTEYFYDAANPTASPLGRVEGASLAFGTPLPNSIAYTKNSAVFLANNNDGSISLRHIEGTKSEELPLPFITILQNAIGSSQASDLRGWFYRQSGSLFYGLTIDGATFPSGSSVFVYSLDFKIWTQFTYGADDGDDAFPVVFTAPTTSNNMVTYFAGNPHGNAPVFGVLNPLTSSETIVIQEIRTPFEDFDSVNLKTMNKLSVLVEDTYGGTNTLSNISIGWSDYSYGSYGNVRTLFNATQSDYAYATQLGAFRRRTIRLQYSNSPLTTRWKAIEFEINKGMR